MSSQAIILFLKAPTKGQVKTRLTRSCDEDFVLELYKAFVQDILRVLQPFENLFLFFRPPEKEKMLKQWLGGDYTFVGQQGENLGQKMANAFETVFEKGFDRAVLVGTDIPEIDNEIMILAGQALEQADGVIGPSQDGGYYLIGLTRSVFSKTLFNDINWSTSEVLGQTLDIFKKQSIQYKLLKKLDDIDTPQDLSALKNRAQQAQRMGQETLRVLASYEA